MIMFETLWQNRYVAPAADEPTLPDLIAALESAASRLRQMHAAGVVLHDAQAGDDFYMLRTGSADAAEEFGLVPSEEFAD
jgi:hypothetical protein